MLLSTLDLADHAVDITRHSTWGVLPGSQSRVCLTELVLFLRVLLDQAISLVSTFIEEKGRRARILSKSFY